MARLPIIGDDRDEWGQILNDYLEVAHNADGSQKDPASPLLVKSTTLSAANLATLGDDGGKELLPVPGGRLYYTVHFIICHYRFVSAPYSTDFSDNFRFLFGSDATHGTICYPPLVTAQIGGPLSPANLLKQTEDAYVWFPVPFGNVDPGGAGDLSLYVTWLASKIENQAVNLTGPNCLDGDGSLTVRLFYSLIDGAP